MDNKAKPPFVDKIGMADLLNLDEMMAEDLAPKEKTGKKERDTKQQQR